MPSANQRYWRGETTSTEECTLNYITESLRGLERSTTLMRNNLSNLIDQESNNELTEIVVEERNNSQIQSVVDFHLEKINQEVQQVLDRNLELKEKVQEVIQNNETFKADISKYMEENDNWKQNYLLESKRIDEDLQSVVVHKATSNNSSESVNSSCGIIKTLWQRFSGVLGRPMSFLRFRNIRDLSLEEAMAAPAFSY